MALASHLFKAGASPESVESSLRGSIASNWLKRVIEYINDRPEADLRVRELAQVCSMSCAHFARLFKGSVGVPPHQYVIPRRVERARKVLPGSGVPLVEIALRSGCRAEAAFTTPV